MKFARVSVAALLLACFLPGCRTPQCEVHPKVPEVLAAHGFTPPASVAAADSSTWIVSERPGKNATQSVERVVVKVRPRYGTPSVEISTYVRGPTDWALAGPLLTSDRRAEADSIQAEIAAIITPK